MFRKVRHKALDGAVVGRADLPVAVLRPLLGRDAGRAEIGARTVGAELKKKKESLLFLLPFCWRVLCM